MTDDPDIIRDHIIEAILPDIAFDGWTWKTVETAAKKAGYGEDMAQAVFPGRLNAAVSHFSDWADRQMITALKDTDPESMRVRDKIKLAVMTRLDVLKPHKEAVRLALSYWAIPPRGLKAGKTLWCTADRIWDWAGDTATDYNRYSKRALLSGVLGTTTFTWLNDDSDDFIVTQEFLDRRIENVMQLGRFLGKIKRTG